jgi:CRISPR-associated protein Csb2
MLAGVMTGGYRSLRPEVEPVLRWIERQPAPQILARTATQLCKYRLAVPNNDMDVIASEWAAGRAANPAELRTMKDVSPREVADPPPHVRYVWPLDEEAERNPEGMLQSAVRLSHCLHSLGWGIDMSFADAELLTDSRSGSDVERWIPGPEPGERLAVPVPGFLHDLELTYARFVRRASGAGVDTDTRPSVYRMQCYARAGERRQTVALLSLLLPDGVREWPPWEFTMIVAAWLRHAAAEAIRGEGITQEVINSFVLGHPPEGSDPSFRLSFAPLPSIGHRYADGRIRRVMIVEPSGSGGDMCRFGPLAADSVVSWYLPTTNRGTAARRWRSVTPVVLHGYNSSHGKISLLKTERLLLRAFEMAGYPAGSIARVAFQAAPLWPGTGAAGQIRVPPHLNALPRYHVEVEFRTDMLGPVLAGVGRHCGLGSFAACG